MTVNQKLISFKNTKAHSMEHVKVFRNIDIYIEIFNKILLIPFTYIQTSFFKILGSYYEFIACSNSFQDFKMHLFYFESKDYFFLIFIFLKMLSLSK